VKTYYPNHPWDHTRFLRHAAGATHAPQIFMSRVLRSVFPHGVKMEHNLRLGHGLVGAVGDPLEIDVYLPEYKLGFEYQVISIRFIIFLYLFFCFAFLFFLYISFYFFLILHFI
jgi:hypothetical protein